MAQYSVPNHSLVNIPNVRNSIYVASKLSA